MSNNLILQKQIQELMTPVNSLTVLIQHKQNAHHLIKILLFFIFLLRTMCTLFEIKLKLASLSFNVSMFVCG